MEESKAYGILTAGVILSMQRRHSLSSVIILLSLSSWWTALWLIFLSKEVFMEEFEYKTMPVDSIIGIVFSAMALHRMAASDLNI